MQNCIRCKQPIHGIPYHWNQALPHKTEFGKLPPAEPKVARLGPYHHGCIERDGIEGIFKRVFSEE